MREKYTWLLPRTTVALGERTIIMGILNVTPDSFSERGAYFDTETATARGKDIEQEGADILDIGGESTRPGSDAISEEEELRRVMPVLESLAAILRIPISIDTYRAAVARRALEAGAQIVNDISAFRFDSAMPAAAKIAGAAVILMHSRGERDTLHSQQPMTDPLKEVLDDLGRSVALARTAGVPDAAIVIDPGIGFGKTAAESLLVLKSLGEFSKLRYPLLVGASRKSFIRSITGDSAEARTWGTAASIAIAIANGAHIIRVHDIRQMRVVAAVADAILGGSRKSQTMSQESEWKHSI
jgi:dihydropteroate synthase